MLKKVTMLFIVCAFSGIYCSDTKNFTEETALINTWAVAVKNKDYQLYHKIEAYPKTAEQFSEIYRDYYPSLITVIDVEETAEEQKDPAGKKFSKKIVKCAGEIVMRSNSRKLPFSGTFDVIQFQDSNNKDSAHGWKIAGRTIIRSE